VLVAPSVADAVFGTPFNLSAVGFNAQGSGPEVALDPSGNAVFVWQGATSSTSQIQTRARSSAGTLGAVQTVATTTTMDASVPTDPDVAVDSNGNAVIVWVRPAGTAVAACGGQKCTRIQLRTRSAGGTLGTVQTISPAGQNASNPEVDVDPNGNAVVVWQRSDGTNTRIQTVARSSGGTLSTVQSLSLAGQNAQSGVVGVDDSGEAVFAWTREDGSTGCAGGSCALTQVRARSATGTLSTTKTLSVANAETFNPRIGVDSTGDAVVSWARQSDVQARTRSSTGTLGSILGLGFRSGVAEDMVAPVAVNAAGDAVFVWTNSNAPMIRALSASGTLGTAQTLAVTGFLPQVGIDSNGNAVAVWRAQDATTNCNGAGCSRIQSRSRSSTGTLGTIQTVSAAGQNAIFPRVAVNGPGVAAAVWERSDGTNLRVQGARQGPPATMVQAGGATNTFSPATVTINQGGTVTWHNVSGLHNVHFDDNSFVMPASPSSSTWTVSRTFNTTGTFRYYCEIHGGPGGVGMSGTVVVN
jgi:plastocyanin